MEEIRSRYGRYAALFGREVDVVINRPLGSTPQTHGKKYHASDIDAKKRKPYPVNCGYITTDISDVFPGIPEGQADGDCYNIDLLPPYYVYVLGVDKPLETFRGRIIAVIHRNVRMPYRDGHTPPPEHSYDRLIIVPDGMELYEPEIRHEIAFAERRGRYRLYCMYEKSCGAVVYTVHNDIPLYLLIRNRSGHIGFPKGHVEYGEDEFETMVREIYEETSLRVTPDPAFRCEYHYVLWGVVHKRAVYSMAQFSYGHSVTTMENEIFGDWLVPFSEAKKLLSYDNDRHILEMAHEKITGTNS